MPVLPHEFYASQDKIATMRVRYALDAAKKHEVKAEGVTTESSCVWETIVETAKVKECDCIVMASHGRRGLSALLIGSETAKVLTHSALPVLVVKGGDVNPPKAPAKTA